MKGISEKGRVLTFPENNAFMAERERVLGVCVSVRWNALSLVSTWKAICFLQYSAYANEPLNLRSIDPQCDFRHMSARWEPSQQGHEGLFGLMEKFFVCLFGRFHRPTHTCFILEIG